MCSVSTNRGPLIANHVLPSHYLYRLELCQKNYMEICILGTKCKTRFQNQCAKYFIGIYKAVKLTLIRLM